MATETLGSFQDMALFIDRHISFFSFVWLSYIDYARVFPPVTSNANKYMWNWDQSTY